MAIPVLGLWKAETDFKQMKFQQVSCIEFALQGFDAFCEKMPEAAPMSAEPISDCGSVSGMTLLRKGKNCWTPTARVREEWQYVRESAQQTPRPVQKEVQLL